MQHERSSTSVEYHIIDPEQYEEILRSDPLWYLHESLLPLILPFQGNDLAATPEDSQRNAEVLQMFASGLKEKRIALGDRPEYFNDDERQKPDIVVIHHTQTDEATTIDELEALGLLRLYALVYRSHSGFIVGGKHQPISSGHFRDGKQTFLGYHHLVRTDGAHEQTLKDGYTGFHAGYYPMNCRSIGISVVDDLTEQEPSPEALTSIARLIRQYNPSAVLGHREVIRVLEDKTWKPVDTICPGNRFLGENGWKRKLFSL